MTPVNPEWADLARAIDAELRRAMAARTRCPLCGQAELDHDDALCVERGRAWRPKGILSGVRPAPVVSADMTSPAPSSRVDVHLHLHIDVASGATAEQVRTIVTDVVGHATTEIEETDMSRNDDLLAAIADLQAGQSQTLTDLQRLLADTGAPQAAIDAVKDLIAQNSQIDGLITAADPSPATVAAPAATDPTAAPEFSDPNA